MQPRVVVDIGNSGLRAAIVGTSATLPNAIPELESVHRLHWSSTQSGDHHLQHRDHDTGTRVPSDPNSPEIFRGLIEALTVGGNGSKALQDSAWTWHVASVFEEAQQQLTSVIQADRPHDRIQIVNHSDIPMKTGVSEPTKLGIDRLLAAFGACVQAGNVGPVIVVQMGTAITVDWVNHNKIMEGGIIFAGRRLALDALHAGTSKLPPIQDRHLVEAAMDLPASNTIAAMLSGVSHSLIGGVRYAVERYRNIDDPNEVPVIVTGGDSRWLLPYLQPPAYQIDDLVLKTLAMLTDAWSNPSPASR